jgi:hypothetical protein
MSDGLENYEKIVERLFEKTRDRKLEWSFEWNEKIPRTPLGAYVIQLRQSDNAEGEPIIYVEILTNRDELVDRFSDETLSSRTTKFEQFPSYFRLMEQLYHLAFREATGADKAIKAIIDELDDDIPF